MASTINRQFIAGSDQFIGRVTRITLQHLNGSNSTIKLLFPIYSWSSEVQELSSLYLNAWVNHLTKHYIEISQFQTALGSIDREGKEHYSLLYFPQEIQLNKIYVPVKPPLGQWKTLEELEKRNTRLRKV